MDLEHRSRGVIVSERRKSNRNLQRAARALALQDSISYQRALESLRSPSIQVPVPGLSLPQGSKAWLKAIHYRHDDWTILPGDDTWISDPGRRDAKGQRVNRADGTPWGQPSWSVGDHIGLYFTGTLKVPVLVEVVAPPTFDPERVQAENDGGEPDAGERWPWRTPVRGVSRTDLAVAPDLHELGIDPELMRRRPKLGLALAQYRRLVRALS
jgi:hypothetical protein